MTQPYPSQPQPGPWGYPPQPPPGPGYYPPQPPPGPGYYPPQPPYGYYPYPPQPYPYPPQPQPQADQEKGYPLLTAATVKGTVLGQAQAQISATLVDNDGEPIKGQPITFTVSGRQIGMAVTDATGVAHLDSGSNLLDPLMWIHAVGSGYEVHYQGNKKYMPAAAHGKIEPGIG
ncbi:Ig-like domain-containing protein [Streptomyces roseoverticillatus]|uniref:Ig-like domain-containing protein n=1 Tax=Streptomyces roseoverticillatus TaxID=66429 RepID=UPI001F3161A3|nr:Ig-like domain-containing protein [Streptomyces roseoverticillatus]MCF3102287.1 Ig-like domain-containing protein [Streptomyces roseoverticillatus]